MVFAKNLWYVKILFACSGLYPEPPNKKWSVRVYPERIHPEGLVSDEDHFVIESCFEVKFSHVEFLISSKDGGRRPQRLGYWKEHE